jgi:hypothetical protein
VIFCGLGLAFVLLRASTTIDLIEHEQYRLTKMEVPLVGSGAFNAERSGIPLS